MRQDLHLENNDSNFDFDLELRLERSLTNTSKPK